MTIYGLLTFDQGGDGFWNSISATRLIGGAIVYAALTCLTALFFRRIAPLFWVCLLTFLTILVLGPLPIIVVSLFFFSSYILGLLALPSNVPLGRPGLPIRILVGVCCYMAAIGTMAHFPVNYRAVYWILLIAPLALRPMLTREAWNTWRRVLMFKSASRLDCLSLAMVGFPVLTAWAATWRPAATTDVLATHLRVSTWMATHHQWPFDFVQTAWALNPLGVDWCFSIAFMLAGEYGMKLLDFGFFVVILSMVSLAVRELSASVFLASLFTALLACSPMAQDLATSLMIETVQAALVLAAFLAMYAYRREPHARSFLATFFLLGGTLSAKFGSLAYALPIIGFAAYVLIQHRHDGRKTSPRLMATLAGALALFFFFGSGPYLYAYLKTRNPIFPYMNDLFKSPFFPTWFRLGQSNPQAVMNWTTPYRLIFESRLYGEFRDGGYGFHWLILLALLAIAAFRKRSFLFTAATVTALISAVAIILSTKNLRYTYAALPLLTIAGAVALQSIGTYSRAVTFVSSAVLLCLIPVNIYFYPAASWIPSRFFLNPWNSVEATRFTRLSDPAREIDRYLNQHHPGEAVAFFHVPQVADLDAEAYTNGWHTQTYSERMNAETDPARCGRYALLHGIRHFVVPADWSSKPATDAVQLFIARYTQPEFAYGTAELRSLLPDAPAMWAHAPPGPVQNCYRNFVDDRDSSVRYTGSWTHREHDGRSCEGTDSVTDAAGDTATLDFSGSEVEVMFSSGPDRGAAEVFVDGVSKGKLDEFAPGAQLRASAIYVNLTPARHRIEVRSLGAHALGSSANTIDLDGFSVR